MKRRFRTGSFCFAIQYPEIFRMPKVMEKFREEAGKEEYTYQIRVVKELPRPQGKQMVQRPDLAVFQTETGEERLIGVKGDQKYYALYREISDCEAEVFVGEWYLEAVWRYEVVFLSLLAIERRLIGKKCLILHCAYTEYRGKAILFSAPSETGKTTQANLWEKYKGSRTVNGDKALLELKENGWTAQGWPVSGTSGVCENEAFQIRDIVVLAQGKVNTVRRLSAAEAFRELFGEITVNRWDRN